MRRILYWNDSMIDLNDSNEFGYSIENFNFSNIISRKVNHLSTLRVPKSEANRITFGFVDNIKSKSTRPYSHGLVRAVYNGIEIFSNYLGKVVESEKHFQLLVFAPGIDFFDQIKASNISLSSASEDWNNTEITAARNNLTENLRAPVIDYGRIIPKDYYFVNEDFTINYKTGWSIVEFSGGIDIFNVVFSFFGSSLNSHYLRSVEFAFSHLPEYNQTITASYQYDISFDFSISSIATTLTVNIYFVSKSGTRKLAATGDYTTTGIKNLSASYTPEEDFHFVEIQLSRAAANAASGTFIGISVTAVYDAVNISTPHYVFALSYKAVINEIISSSGYQNAIDWDIIDSIVLKAWEEGPVTDSISSTEGEDYSDRLSITVAPEIISGTTVNWGDLLQEITKHRCFQDFVIRFCLIVFVKDNTVFARPLEYILADRSNALDWTDKRDTSKEDKIIFNSNVYARNNYFRDPAYNDESEHFERALEIDNDTLEFKKTLYESCFSAPSVATRGLEDWDEVPIIKLFDPANNQARTFKNAKSCLIWMRDAAESDPDVEYGGSTETSYKVARYFFAVSPSDLYVGSSWDFFLRVFYRNLNVVLNDLKPITRYYNLTEIDINNYTPFKQIYDNGNYYYLMNLKDYIPGRVTKVEMFKIT